MFSFIKSRGFFHKILAVLIAFGSLNVADAADTADDYEVIQFPRGSESTVVKGDLVRGEVKQYRFRAKEHQYLSVDIDSLEQNAVFQIYRVKGQEYLAGAGEMEDAVRWAGRLEKSGEYVVVVGGTRGNVSYSLTVDIK